MGQPTNWKKAQNRKKAAEATRQRFDSIGALDRAGAGRRKGHGMTKEELRAQAEAAVSNFTGEVRKIPTVSLGEHRKTRSNREP
jgi:hypothetical protein